MRILQNENLKPGAYVTEIDKSQVADVSNAPTNTAFFYGLAKKGVVGRPVYVNTPRQLIELFGQPFLMGGNNLRGTLGLWVAYQYLQTGIGGIWFQRVTNSADANKRPYLLYKDVTNSAFVDGDTGDVDKDITWADTPVSTDWEDAYVNDPLKVDARLFLKNPVYKISETEVSTIQVKVVGLTAWNGTKVIDDLNSIVGETTAKDTTIKWAKVQVFDTSVSATTPVETFLINNTREPMDNSLVYFASRLNRSNYIGIAIPDEAEETAIATFFTRADSNGFTITYATGTIPATSTYDGSLAEVGAVPSIDRRKYPFKSFFVNGFNVLGDSTIKASIASLIRKNSSLVYGVGSVQTSGGRTYAEYLTGGELNIASIVDSNDQVASRFFPYLQSVKVFDPFTKKTMTLPASVNAYLNINSINPWEIPAGLNRGGISALKVVPELQADEIGYLYNTGKINCIDKTNTGYFIWGQRTGQKTPSARDRIHAVRSLIELETELESSLTRFVFERATPTTLSNITKTIENIKKYYTETTEAFVKFEYEIDTSLLEFNQLDINVRVVPTEAIEFINVNVTISRDTATNVIETAQQLLR